MDPKFSPAFVGALMLAVVVLMIVAIAAEQWRRRRDRSDGVLLAWDDLRLTPTHLIVGSRRDARRIPLTGLSARVDFAATPGRAGRDDSVHLVIENAGHDIRRSQPYSYGSSGNAQMFAIKFNALSGHDAPAPHLPSIRPDDGFGGPADRLAA
jgi:hypothetical protein